MALAGLPARRFNFKVSSVLLLALIAGEAGFLPGPRDEAGLTNSGKRHDQLSEAFTIKAPKQTLKVLHKFPFP